MKIMQVINKTTNFESGVVDLKLYQTGFKTLTKIITSVPGQTVENAQTKNLVGYQFFHDLNNKQLEVRKVVDRYKVNYNDVIATYRRKVPNLIDFLYNWTSCVDYKSQIKSGDKADYKLFTKLVAAEKELYDYKNYSYDHIKRNAETLGQWGKDKRYVSCFHKAVFIANQFFRKFTFVCKGIRYSMPEHTLTSEMVALIDEDGYGQVVGATGTNTITKTSISNDSYLSISGPYQYTYDTNGKIPTHFTSLTVYSLAWFKSLVLL